MGGRGSLRNARMYGLIGSILGILSGFTLLIPPMGMYGVGGLGLAGFILVLLAVREVANATGREEIFRYYLYSLIINVMAIVIIVGSTLALLASVFSMVSIKDPSSFLTVHFRMTDIGAFYGILVWMLVLLATIITCLILSAHYIKKSYYMIAEEVGVNTFRTAGLLYFLGALLSIIIVGFAILFIAKILEVIAWASLPEKPVRKGKIPPPPPPPVL